MFHWPNMRGLRLGAPATIDKTKPRYSTAFIINAQDSLSKIPVTHNKLWHLCLDT